MNFSSTHLNTNFRKDKFLPFLFLITLGFIIPIYFTVTKSVRAAGPQHADRTVLHPNRT